MTAPTRQDVRSAIQRAAAFAWSDKELDRVTDAVMALIAQPEATDA